MAKKAGGGCRCVLLAGVMASAGVGCGTSTERVGPSPHGEIAQASVPGDSMQPTKAGVETPTTLESAGLKWMREEEKLARDVYLNSLERYGLRIFENISASEQRHMDAVRALIDSRGLSDPAADTARGEFRDPTLAALFNTLDAKSSVSEVAALEVGAEIEEIDIQDLLKEMGRTTDPEILRVYENLSRGSRNHLRAFVRNLDRRGVRYSPRHLDAETFAKIIAHEQERGRGHGRHRR